jgi:hypothetical protein
MKDVYSFKIYDVNSDAYKLSQKYATKEYIESINAVIIETSKKEVEDNQIDSDGIYIA